jgi:hypothetical protein
MLHTLQTGGTWSLNLNLEPVEYTKGVRVRFQTQETESRNPEDLRTALDIHMSAEEFEKFKQAINSYA